MQNATFDHYTIRVRDLEVSATFYQTILGLIEIKNRTEKSHIRWFSVGNGELHLVQGNLDEIQTNVGVHLAFRVSDFDQFLELLEANEITPHNSKGSPGETTVRTDGVKQVYLKDPDGYWIEVNNATA